VLTEPDESAAVEGAPAVLFLNAGLLHHVGPHRLHVNLARRLARAGVRSLRFDLSGIGDSGPRRDRMSRDESLVRETQEAMDSLAASHGIDRFVLFGICTGADQAVRVAIADPRVVGSVLVDGYTYQTSTNYLYFYLGRFLLPHSWWSVLTLRHPAYARLAPWRRRAPARANATSMPVALRPGIYVSPPRAEAEAHFGSLADRDCRLCFVFTPSVTYCHAAHFDEMFPSLKKHPAIRVVFLKHANHVFTLKANQEALMNAVEEWVLKTLPGGVYR